MDEEDLGRLVAVLGVGAAGGLTRRTDVEAVRLRDVDVLVTDAALPEVYIDLCRETETEVLVCKD